MIEGNLKLTHMCIFYLYLNWSFEEVGDKIHSWVRIGILAMIVIWPFVIAIFLYCKRAKLEDPTFKGKFVSMYVG